MKFDGLYMEPRKEILGKITNVPDEPEMTAFESGFLCGLLKTYKPKKIVEVGVAAGGTTSIILQCLEMLKYDYKMFSVDLSERFYRDEMKNTGFMALEAKTMLHVDETKHKFLCGQLLPSRLEEIGEGIDFIILDTTHALPGEMLDFLAALPYLNQNAVVVLHDINQFYGGAMAYATKLLYDVVTADKLVVDDSDRIYAYPNIAAFQISHETQKNVIDCFSALTMPWEYILTNEQFEAYYRCFLQQYNGMAEIFKMSYEWNCDFKQRHPEPLKMLQRLKRCARVLLRGY